MQSVYTRPVCFSHAPLYLSDLEGFLLTLETLHVGNKQVDNHFEAGKPTAPPHTASSPLVNFSGGATPSAVSSTLQSRAPSFSLRINVRS